MFNKGTIVCVVVLFVSVNVWAGTDLERPPLSPEPLVDGESIEPEVDIIQKDDRTIEEYRYNGNLYMIKVIPIAGPPYYYIDTDGDGSLESQQYELGSGLVPSWILFKW